MTSFILILYLINFNVFPVIINIWFVLNILIQICSSVLSTLLTIINYIIIIIFDHLVSIGISMSDCWSSDYGFDTLHFHEF